MNVQSEKEIYRGYEITAIEVKRGFKFIVRYKESGELVWSSRPVRHSSLGAMVEAAKTEIDQRFPPTLGVQSSESVDSAERFGG
jgi:hypothetical protein